METWLECSDKLTKGDVLRWKEAVFEERKSRARKPVFLGEREVDYVSGNANRIETLKFDGGTNVDLGSVSVFTQGGSG